ncbi:S-layer homology domain-containing protein [Cohnella xylanilytica]|uniref:S-layer homology domain-containing protein n=1 Tax=Cohnella xylanilytica TaxID=557555 RepID=A0A841UA16_9BACL|nr:S-layer homology domain-containing protein [Cohnella xylanilytica]MBB6695828.1 S-layer homology domain-containing protein [Cohnella xylanilytica]
MSLFSPRQRIRIRMALLALLALCIGLTGTFPPLGAASASAASPSLESQSQVPTETPPPQETQGAAELAGASALAAPVIDALPPFTNESSVVIKGQAPPSASVTVSYTYNSEPPVALEPVAADAEGRFRTSLSTNRDGRYTVTAVAALNGETSNPSEPVPFTADDTPTGGIRNYGWELLANNRVLLHWEPPTVIDENGNEVPDPTIDRYLIYDSNGTELAKTTNTEYVFSSPDPGSRVYIFEIRVLDLAGNQTDGQKIYAGTSPPSETLLTELTAIDVDKGEIAMSGDGSTIAYIDTERVAPKIDAQTGLVEPLGSERPDDNANLYLIDTKTKMKTLISVTQDGAPLNGKIKAPAISRDGGIIAFTSKAINLIPGTDPPLTLGIDRVYLYNRAAQSIELISDPNLEAGEASVSGNGDLIVYRRSDGIFLYDRTSKTTRRVSQTTDGQAEDGQSGNPAISADGSAVVFLTTSSNLKVEGGYEKPSASNGLILYDVQRDQLTQAYFHELPSFSPSLNADGRYIVYPRVTDDDIQELFLIDTDSGTDTELYADVPDESKANREHLKAEISADGKYVLSDVFDFDPDVPDLFYVIERFNRETGALETVGNPAVPFQGYGEMDDQANRVAYIRDRSALFTMCFEDCGSNEPDDLIVSAKWSVSPNDSVQGQIKPGSVLTIQAYGTTGQSVKAAVNYRQFPAGDPDNVQSKDTTVDLAESPSSPGTYTGFFAVDEGVTEILSITAKLADGSSPRPAGQLPVQVAGIVSIDVDLTGAEWLAGTHFYLSGTSADPIRQALEPGKGRYELYWPTFSDLSVAIRSADDQPALAEQTGLTVRSARATAVTLTPAFPASLKVVATATDTGQPVAGAKVTFKEQGSGRIVAEADTDTRGEADLPNLSAGGKFAVTVKAPAGYLQPADQNVTLKLGANTLSFPLAKISSGMNEASMSFPKQAGNGSFLRPVIGSEATVNAKAPAGLSVNAKVRYRKWTDGSEPVPDEKIVQLTESAENPGSYSGPFLIAEGTARIDSLQLQIDGIWIDQTFQVEKPVASRLRLKFDIPESWSATLRQAVINVGYHNPNYGIHYYDFTRIESDALAQEVDVPFDKSEFHIFIKPADDRMQPIEFKAASPDAGKTLEVDIAPKYRISLSGTVKDENGSPLEAAYSLMIPTGKPVANGTANGSFSLAFDSPPSEQYVLKIAPTNPAYEVWTGVVTADGFAKTAEAVLPLKPAGNLRGSVTGTDGKPAAGVLVTATLVQEGISKTYTAKTEANGAYSLKLPSGSVEVRASGNAQTGYLSPAHTVKIQENGDHRLDLKLMNDARIDFKLYTKEPGGAWQGPVDIDGTTFYHLHFSSSREVIELGPPFRVRAVTGDEVRICVDGREAKLPTACQQATIGPDNKASMEMRLENTGASAEFIVLNPDGSQSYIVSAKAYGLNGGGTSSYYGFHDNDGRKDLIELYTPGNYRMEVTGGAGLSSVVEFTVAAGQKLDLGQIRLQAPGKFGNQYGNGLSASVDTAAQGSRISLRASYSNVGSPNGPATDASLILELPPQTDAIPGTLVVNGKAAEAAVSGRTLTVPLGNIALYDKGSIQLQLKVKGDAAVSNVLFAARIRYSDGTQVREESLGTASVQLFAVTMRAPEKVLSRLIELNGNAPAGEQVTVYDGDQVIGRAAVTPSGTWSLSAELADTGWTKHRLRTETTFRESRLPGQSATVQYVPDDPGLEEVTMRQADGRVQSFKPENGIAVFPFVVIPGQPFIYTLKFRDPSRIYDVRIGMGGASADVKPTDGKFAATIPYHQSLGPISVDYRVKEKPAGGNPDPRLPEAGVRNQMPFAVRYFKEGYVVKPGGKTPDGKTVPPNTVQGRIQLRDGVWANFLISDAEAQGYKPTEADKQRARETGIPVYGLELEHSESSNLAVMNIRGFAPKDPPEEDEFLQLAMQIALEWEPAAGDDDDSWIASLFGEEPFGLEWVGRALEAARELCDPAARKSLTAAVEDLLFEMYFHEAYKDILQMAGVYATGDWVGIGDWQSFFLAGSQFDAIASKKLKELEDEIRKFGCSKWKPWGVVAYPKYIWDPSGYVYEGYKENKVEGVTATALTQDPETKAWNVWDADWYGQKNPQLTDPGGRYGWDVPEGKWQVRYEKQGYETAFSDELGVPPPQLDVNVPVVSYLPPEVVYVRAQPGGSQVEVGFNRPILGESLRNDSIAVTDAGGTEAPGNVQLKDPRQTGQDGKALSKVLVFRPDVKLTAGQTYTLKVKANGISSYAGVPLASDYTASVAVEAEDRTPPADVTELTGGIAGGTAALTWKAPADRDYRFARVRWKEAGETGEGHSVDAGEGQSWIEIAGLDRAKEYQFVVKAVDEAGNESSGATIRLIEISPGVDLAPPNAVRDLAAKPAGPGKLAATWTDPSSTDLAKLRLTWAQADQDTGAQTAEVAKGAGGYTITGLKPLMKYKVTIVAFDANGNASSAMSVVAETAAGSNQGSGGGSTGGGTDTGGDPKPEDEPKDKTVTTWDIGQAGGAFEAFDGRLKLRVDAGTFEDGTKLTAKEQPASAAESLPASYRRYSPTYVLSAENAKPRRPFRLALRFDPAAAPAVDIRRLGIYKKNESGSSGWTYIGGIAHPGENRVSANIGETGEYALLLYDRPFADLTAHWARPDIDVLVSRHLVSGVADNRYEPNRPITRAEIFRLLVELLRQNGKDASNAEVASPPSFKDVSPDAWYAPFVEAAARLGLAAGDGGRVRPNDAVSREELAALFRRSALLIGYEPRTPADPTALGRFADADRVSGWARESLAYAVSQGWIRGSADTRLNPNGQATRAEASAALLRVLTSLGAIASEP